MVQRNAMKTWQEGGQLLDRLKADKDVTKYIPPHTLEPLFDMSYHTKHVDTIFKRVFGQS
jgi:adenylosuccinate lyase